LAKNDKIIAIFMNLNLNDIKHIAALSRLELADDEVEKYHSHLVSILNYFDKLAEVNTEGVPEMAMVSGSLNVWRHDEAVVADVDERDAIMTEFPRKQGSLMEVPAVFEERPSGV
jgi:aspartyl-tRNA(Asn)/glutamyl-tRNA(Gln) amidotransferase subunit C